MGAESSSNDEPDGQHHGEGDGAKAGPRILLVEDEALIRLYLVDLLGDLQFTVCGVATTSAQAMEFARATKPDLALVDIGLRGKTDGIATAEQLRAQFEIPTIFLSGNSDSATLERAMMVGPVDFIEKPFRPERLVAALEKALSIG